MSRDIEDTITHLKELLPYVAHDAKRYRNSTELIKKSHELHMAARAIDETLADPSLASTARSPVIRVRIGTKVVEAYEISDSPYEFLTYSAKKAEPGDEYELLFKHRVPTDILHTNQTQPVYGQSRYFDLATLGRTLQDGGDLFASEPDSSSSK